MNDKTKYSCSDNAVSCPVCNREFDKDIIEKHVNKCIFLNTLSQTNQFKRNGSPLEENCTLKKKTKVDVSPVSSLSKGMPTGPSVTAKAAKESSNSSLTKDSKNIPLAETMRPVMLEDIVGQAESFGAGSMLYSMLSKKKIPNMILWGPPGCGKTSLANIISHICKEEQNLRFVKLSATMAGINNVKEVVKVAKHEAQFKRQTVLFMDEIHRFNKLQQDSFLPHVENGTITLVGATTENPSFSLNNALLSRCRVVVLSKLTVLDVSLILERAVVRNKLATIVDNISEKHSPDEEQKWQEKRKIEEAFHTLARSHMLYDKQGEEHYNIVSAIHKSIRASDDSAALYWTARALHGGEDPLYVARRLVRAAAEDIGLADPNALVEAVACLQGCQHIGMPECDVLLAQCAVRLARADKSTEVYRALRRAQRSLVDTKGPLPSVPLHLRNAPTRLMKDLGYGKNYNMKHRDESGLTYMPEGMENINFFNKNNTD